MDKKDSQILLESRLDGSTRNKIIKDVVNSIQKQWLKIILQIIHLHYCNIMIIDKKTNSINQHNLIIENINKRWLEDKYSKNICGDIISLSFYSSRPAERFGLTHNVLGDIMWSMYLCLSKELTTALGRSLYIEENNKILDSIYDTFKLITELWIKTSNIRGNITAREGLLPAKWTLEHKEILNKLEDIKQKGVDAKFSDGPYDLLWKAHIIKCKNTKNELTSILNKRSSLPVQTCVESCNIPSLLSKDEFNKLQLELSTNLKLKLPR